jgi:hypothetical protein
MSAAVIAFPLLHSGLAKVTRARKGAHHRMHDTKDIDKDIHAALDRLARENAELNGLSLATGVILTQLLQTMCLRELNPQAAATKIISNAQKAIEGFKPEEAGPLDAVMKARALQGVKQYEDQIRSVLPI